MKSSLFPKNYIFLFLCFSQIVSADSPASWESFSFKLVNETKKIYVNPDNVSAIHCEGTGGVGERNGIFIYTDHVQYESRDLDSYTEACSEKRIRDVVKKLGLDKKLAGPFELSRRANAWLYIRLDTIRLIGYTEKVIGESYVIGALDDYRFTFNKGADKVFDELIGKNRKLNKRFVKFRQSCYGSRPMWVLRASVGKLYEKPYYTDGYCAGTYDWEIGRDDTGPRVQLLIGTNTNIWHYEPLVEGTVDDVIGCLKDNKCNEFFPD